MTNAYGMEHMAHGHVTEAGIDIMSEPRYCVLDTVATGLFKKITQMHAFRAYIFAIV